LPRGALSKEGLRGALSKDCLRGALSRDCLSNDCLRGALSRDCLERSGEFGDELPVLPIRNAVLFPGAVAPFDVGREKSVALVEDIDNLDQPVIAIFAQRDPST
jgi:hypothetical protein